MFLHVILIAIVNAVIISKIIFIFLIYFFKIVFFLKFFFPKYRGKTYFFLYSQSLKVKLTIIFIKNCNYEQLFKKFLSKSMV